MIIRTHVDISKLVDINKVKTGVKEKEVNVELVNKSSKKKHKKPASAPIAEEMAIEVPVIEETVAKEAVEETKNEEEIDLSEWLKEEE